MSDTDVIEKKRVRTKLRIDPPSLYNVIVENDNVTTFEFVVELMQAVFDYTEADAEAFAKRVDREDGAVAGTFYFEISEQKVAEAMMAARANNFPLTTRMEKA